MFGHLLRVTGTVLVIAVALVTPVLVTATATPASADTVINGCTVVSNPTPTNFTNCPGANLSQANLSGVNLTYANLTNANLESANLTGATLFSCTFNPSAVCASATLTGANAPLANLDNVNMVSCSPSGTQCLGLDLTGIDLSGATFTGATVGTCLSGTSPPVCGGANLSRDNLTGTNFAGDDLSSANLAGAQFATYLEAPDSSNPADLSGANLTDANLTGASLASCNNVLPALVECLSATLTNANLTGANLSQSGWASCGNDTIATFCAAVTSLSGVNLSGANLTGAELGICFTDDNNIENCAEASLTGATLTGANLTGVALFSGGISVPSSSTALLVPLDQTVTATSLAGAVVTWPTPPGLGGATPGSCTTSSGLTSGSTFPIGATTFSCQVLDGQGNVATGSFTVTVQPVQTSVLLPSFGAILSGDSWLDAGSSGPVGVASVRFEISSVVEVTGGTLSDQVISGSTPTLYGWIGAWNATSVPNGTYTLQSVATDVDGVSVTSAPVTINVNNPAASTAVIIPSTGATQSGTSALLDASSTADVTGVSYELSGGTLTNQVIATGGATIYGWLAEWNTTSVPNGTYTLQSVGTTATGSVTSAPITITVSN